MSVTIRHNGNEIVGFDQFNVYGQEAVGGYGFTFTLRGNRKAIEQSMSIFDIRLTLKLSDPRKPITNSIISSNQVIQCTNLSGTNEQQSFETIFTKEQVNALEEYRKDGDLALNLGLRALTSLSGDTISSYDLSDMVIPREQWLNALKNAGFRQTILFEVPLPLGDKNLNDLYSKAQEFIETGHYKQAVMQCRQIIEHIESLREDKSKSSKANNMAHNRAERQEMTVIERMLSMREQIKNVCQLGAHGDEHFSRSQAKAVLGVTMSLLAEPTVGFQGKYQL